VKAFIRRLLNMLGLVTAGRHAIVVRQLREAEASAKRSSKLLQEVREESRGWKLKADEALKQVKAAQAELARQTSRVEKLTAELSRAGEKAAARQSDLETLQKRVVDAERDLGVAREHLMAIEVKLDILEGAANILDERTRIVVAQQAGEPGVAV
jgi:chromosome segregation ATPase